AQFVAQGLFPVDRRMKLTDFNIPGAELKRFAAVHQTIPTYPEGHAFWSRPFSSAAEKFSNSLLEGQIPAQQYAAELEAILPQ
ncbi:MAG: hypothetical protein ABSG85_09060, partial [Spirochaetia bacterium]